MLRKILALVVIAAASAAIYEWAWLPFRCNATIGRARRALDVALADLDPYQAHTVGLRNLEQLDHCSRLQPDNRELILLMGESLEAAGRHAAARDIYCRGLLHNRSDGLLTLACARTQLLTGHLDEAQAKFIRLGQFHGPSIVREIADPGIRAAMMASIGTRHKRLLKLEDVQLVENGEFRDAGGAPEPAKRRLRATAAADWYLLNEGAAQTSTRFAELAGVDGLEVTTTARGGGIQQLLQTRRNERVAVAVSVFVVSGKVCVGASNGRDLMTTECSKANGKWETLQAVSESCPVRQVAIRASTPGGARFIVGEVEAFVTYAFPPCE